jgi:hypothetical protein
MCLNEICIKVRIGKRLIAFLSKMGLKHGDTLWPLLFNFVLVYAIKKVEENQVGLKLNGTRELLACAYDAELLGDNTETKTQQL